MFLGQESAAEDRSYAKRVPEPGRHLSSEEHLRLSPAGVVERVWNHAGDGFERPRPLAPVEEVCGGHVLAHLVARRMPLPDRDHPLGVRVRQRPEDQRIEQARDGNRTGDAEREYEHGGGGKSRGLPQHPQAVPHVVNHLGVGGELTSKPGGIGQGAKYAPNEIHLRPPVQMLAALQHVPAVTDFGLPLAAPVFPRRRRDQPPEHANDHQAQRERNRVSWRHVRLAKASAGAGLCERPGRARGTAKRRPPAAPRRRP